MVSKGKAKLKPRTDVGIKKKKTNAKGSLKGCQHKVPVRVPDGPPKCWATTADTHQKP